MRNSCGRQSACHYTLPATVSTPQRMRKSYFGLPHYRGISPAQPGSSSQSQELAILKPKGILNLIRLVFHEKFRPSAPSREQFLAAATGAWHTSWILAQSQRFPHHCEEFVFLEELRAGICRKRRYRCQHSGLKRLGSSRPMPPTNSTIVEF